MKKILAREVILAFPDFNKTFEIYTDASDTQLGAVIAQDNKPIAFYSKKLNPAQTRYTTTEKELLSIVETCKEFRTILLGQQITIYTDNENLTYKMLEQILLGPQCCSLNNKPTSALLKCHRSNLQSLTLIPVVPDTQLLSEVT